MHFWNTVETIDRSAVSGFNHYDAEHVIWLAMFVCFALVCSILYVKVGPCSLCKTGHHPEGCHGPYCRKHMRALFALVLILEEIFKYILVAMNHIPFYEYAPLQLCYLSLLLVIVHAFMNDESRAYHYVGNFLYLVGLPAGLSALLFPSWTALPAFANGMSIHCFSSHILFVTYIIMLVAAGDIRPDFRTVPASVLGLFIMAAGVYIYDICTGCNFMFLIRLSAGSPLAPFEALGDYRIGYIVILAALVIVMYGVPGIIRRSGPGTSV